MKKKTEDTSRKALDRLMKALMGTEPLPVDVSRMDVIEEALSYASLALGMDLGHDQVVDELDALAVQILLDRMNRDGKEILHIEVNGDGDQHIVTILGLVNEDYVDVALEAIEELIEVDAMMEDEDEDDEEEVTSPNIKKPDFSIN